MHESERQNDVYGIVCTLAERSVRAETIMH